MNDDILREAVRLADGWVVEHDKITRGYVQSPLSDPSRMMLAGLASQLISQVDAMGYVGVTSGPNETGVYDPNGDDMGYATGPNRDENSIIACVEFLRGLKDG